MRRTRVGIVLSFWCVGGCYQYHAVRPTDALLESRARATVTSTLAAELTDVLPTSASTITGKLVERGGDYLILEVPVYGTAATGAGRALHNRIDIRMEDLVSLESRSLSTWRTGVAIGVVLAAVGGTWVIATRDARPGGDKPGTGVDNAIISIPFSFLR